MGRLDTQGRLVSFVLQNKLFQIIEGLLVISFLSDLHLHIKNTNKLNWVPYRLLHYRLALAFQKSLASTRWQSVQNWPLTTKSTINTCWRTAPPRTSAWMVSLTLILLEWGSVHTKPASIKRTRFSPFSLAKQSPKSSLDSREHLIHCSGGWRYL